MTPEELISAIANGLPINRNDYPNLIQKISPWDIAKAFIQRFDSFNDVEGLYEALQIYVTQKRPDLIDRVMKERHLKILPGHQLFLELYRIWQAAENQLTVVEEIRTGQPMTRERQDRIKQLAPSLQGIAWANVAIYTHNFSALHNSCDNLIESGGFDVMLDVIHQFGPTQNEKQEQSIEYFRYIASQGAVGRLIWKRVRTGRNIEHRCWNCDTWFESQKIIFICENCYGRYGITDSVYNDVVNPRTVTVENELPVAIKLIWDKDRRCYFDKEEEVYYPADYFD